MKSHFLGAVAAIALIGASSAAFAAARVHHPASQMATEQPQTTTDGEVFMQPHESALDRVMVESTLRNGDWSDVN